jgi:hypothetical protein
MNLKLEFRGGAAVAPLEAVSTQLPPVIDVSYRVLVSIKEGLHRGTAFVAPSSQGVLLGSSTDCDLVLMDEGVPARALSFFEQNGCLAAKVLDMGVQSAGIALPLGTEVFNEPSAMVRIGGAELRVELLRRSVRQPLPQSAASSAPLEKKPWLATGRHWVGVTLVGLFMAATFGVVASAMNGSMMRNTRQSIHTLGDVLKPFNAQGAQLVAAKEADERSVVRGLVVDAAMRDKLEQSIRTSDLKAELQLHDVQQMSESLTRLARLNNHTCEAHHLGGGRFMCDAGVADTSLVARLQALPSQVPGVTSLEVHARAPEPKPVVNKAPEPLKVEEPVTSPKLPVIRHVAISERARMAFDTEGRWLHVGDQVDGFKVTRIDFDKVELMQGKRRYSISISPIGMAVGVASREGSEQRLDEISRQ